MFLAGEFSTIARVSKRQLRFYDEIGLLKPFHVDHTNGYRYYSANQLPRLNQILALKDLGLTLEQIKTMIDGEISDEEISGMLLLKKAEMEQAVAEDLLRLRRIEARIAQNSQDEDSPEVVIKSIPEQPFLAVRSAFSSEQDLFRLVEQMMKIIPANIGAKWLGLMAGVFWDESFLATNNDIEIGYLLKKRLDDPVQISTEHTAGCKILPAVETMATAVQTGSREGDILGFGKIAEWIEENGYEIAGPYREIVFDAHHPHEIDGATFEIQMPVRKKTST